MRSHTFGRQALGAGLLMLLAGLLTGCATYAPPGGGADFSLFVDHDIEREFERGSASSWPAHLVAVRVQDAHYTSHTTRAYGNGRFSIVNVRDVEHDEDFDRIAELPDVAQVGQINRLLLPSRLDSDKTLRLAAARLHADMLLVYTFDTDFFTHDAARPLTVITLGLSPNQMVHVTTTASALVLDVRTGFVYGVCEATSQQKQLASAWTSDDAVDATRLKTERAAFEELLGKIEEVWHKIREQHGGASGTAPRQVT